MEIGLTETNIFNISEPVEATLLLVIEPPTYSGSYFLPFLVFITDLQFTKVQFISKNKNLNILFLGLSVDQN